MYVGSVFFFYRILCTYLKTVNPLLYTNPRIWFIGGWVLLRRPRHRLTVLLTFGFAPAQILR